MSKVFLSESQINAFLALALSWCFGTVSVALQLYVYYLLGIGWDLLYLVIPWGILAVYYYFNGYLTVNLTFNVKPNSLFILGSLFYITIFLITSLEATLHPIVSWDAVASWYLGGKAFFTDGGISASYINYANNSTPPFFNLLIAFMYIGMGEVNDTLVSVIYPIYLISSGIVFLNLSSKYLIYKFAILSSILYMLTPNLLRHGGRYDVGYADLPIGFYILVVLFLLYLFFKSSSNSMLCGLIFVISATTLIRNEAFPFYILLTFPLIIFLNNNKIFNKAKFIFVGYSLFASWQLLSLYFDFPRNPFIQQIPDFRRTPIVIWLFFKEMLNIYRWNFLWVAFLVTIIPYFKSMKDYYEKTILFLFIGQIAVYFTVYLMTPLDPASHINNSFDRLLIHLAPIAGIILVIYVSRVFEKIHLQKDRGMS